MLNYCSNVCCFRSWLWLGVFLCFVVTGEINAQPVEKPDKPADVRLVIDVSGSMKRNDPNNLRQPAVELLVQLLPEKSKAGVWTFGKWVNMLVPHKIVDDAWRKNAENSAKKINSVGLFTNIGEALEKAAYDGGDPNQNFRSSIILLTDGMVDIDKSPEKNKKEWRRIVDTVIPKLKKAGFTVHTIALSDNADKNLMTKLSISTDGIAEVAHSAEELMSIFLKAFDVAAPAEQVPLTDNQFVIDSSVEEFTALIFREKPGEQTTLIGPDQARDTAAKHSSDMNWHRAANYDLITVKRPLEGSWMVDATMASDSRITVVSNLNLRVRPLPNNIFKGHNETLSLSLQEDGKTVTREEFLNLMDINADMEAGNDEFTLQRFWQQKLTNPKKGVYQTVLPLFDKDGIYQLNVLVDGKSFVRQFNHQFTVRQPFGAEVKQVYTEGKLEYRIIANAYNTNIDVKETQVVATIATPNRRKKIMPLDATDVDTWQTTLLPDKEGEYRATIKAKGRNQEGEMFEITLPPISFIYSIDGGFVEAKEPFFEPTPTPKPEITPEVTPTPEEVIEEVIEETIEETSEDLAVERPVPSWMLYVILGVGNLVVFVGGYFLFRKIMGPSPNEEVLEQFSEEKINEEAETPEEAAAEPDPEPDIDEEEPPMEDLDAASEEPVPTEDEPDDLDLDTEDDDLDPVSEPEIADDGFDDLDEMAMEQNSDPDNNEQDAPAEEEDEDDMVAAMLKAQGLDLAEDELDDAISSLIDDLEHEQNDDTSDEDEDKQQ